MFATYCIISDIARIDVRPGVVELSRNRAWFFMEEKQEELKAEFLRCGGSGLVVKLDPVSFTSTSSLLHSYYGRDIFFKVHQIRWYFMHFGVVAKLNSIRHYSNADVFRWKQIRFDRGHGDLRGGFQKRRIHDYGASD